MQRPTTSRMASRTRSGTGSSSPLRSWAMRRAMRRAAATRKCPEPHAGSQTVTASRAATLASVSPGVPAAAVSTGSSALSSSSSVSEDGV